jgi:hypothetical protein
MHWMIVVQEQRRTDAEGRLLETKRRAVELEIRDLMMWVGSWASSSNLEIYFTFSTWNEGHLGGRRPAYRESNFSMSAWE